MQWKVHHSRNIQLAKAFVNLDQKIDFLSFDLYMTLIWDFIAFHLDPDPMFFGGSKSLTYPILVKMYVGDQIEVAGSSGSKVTAKTDTGRLAGRQTDRQARLKLMPNCI